MGLSRLIDVSCVYAGDRCNSSRCPQHGTFASWTKEEFEQHLARMRDGLWSRPRGDLGLRWADPDVKIDIDEWLGVSARLQRDKYPVDLGHRSVNFGVTLRIWTITPVPQVPPETLCSIADLHLPGRPEKGGDTVLDYALEVFSPLVLAKQNADIFQWYGLPAPTVSRDQFLY